MTEITYPHDLSPLSRAEILAKMHQRLDDERFNHCLRVEAAARELAARFDVDVDRAGLAGLLHDYAKQVPAKDYRDLIETQGLDPDLLAYGRGIWHGLVGVWFIQRELGVADPEVLQAIARHTTGDPEMTPLDEIIFVADFIEPARDLPGEIAARTAAQTDLLEATLIELTNTLGYLIDNRKVVYPKTLATYNALIKR